MSRYTMKDMQRARKVLTYGHCGNDDCDCARCVADHAVRVYTRLYVAVTEMERGGPRPNDGGEWLKRMAMMLER